MEDEQTEFCCPVCFEIPSAEIYQCINGHTICHVCSATIRVCPQCRVKFGAQKIRCRALEVVLDKKKFKCSNRQLGCQVKISRNELPGHLEICSFRQNKIELCQNLGYDCNFTATANNVDSISQHFKETHHSLFLKNRCGSLFFVNFKDVHSNKTKSWVPLFLIEKYDGRDVLFMTVAQINSNKTFSLITLCLDKSREVAENFGVNYSVVSDNKKVFQLEWNTCAVSVMDAKETINTPPIQVSVNLLLSNYVNREVLKVNVSVFQRNQDTVVINDAEYFLVMPAETSAEHSDSMDLARNAGREFLIPDVYCDGCSHQIKGVIHHCIQCANYVLCSNCAKLGMHSYHLFVKIKNEIQYEALARICYDNM